MPSFSRPFRQLFVPFRANFAKFGMLNFDCWIGWVRRPHGNISNGCRVLQDIIVALELAGVLPRGNGGEGWIRTSVRLRGQIYSLLPLTTRPPLHRGHAGRTGRRAMWRRTNRLSTRSAYGSAVSPLRFREAQRAPISNLPPAGRAVAPREARALHARLSPGQAVRGAGEGNRTLVVSLEGFCSTIELHPLRPKRTRQMASPLARQPTPLLDLMRFRGLASLPMTHLNAIAATATARLWWCGRTLAARWRD
jgi:hypothetical protein